MTNHGTVLLIEDDADQVLLIKKACNEAGVINPLQTVNCYKDAVAYFSGEGVYANRASFPLPFLVILDLNMSGEDGFAVLRWLFERPGLRKKFTVVTTNNSGPDQEVQLAYELGTQSYLLKPADPKELVTIIRRVKEYWIELNLRPGDEA